jgi:hypothetical protein
MHVDHRRLNVSVAHGSETITAPEARTIDVDVSTLDKREKALHGHAAVQDALSEDLVEEINPAEVPDVAER